MATGATEDAVLGASSAARRHSCVSPSPPRSIGEIALEGHADPVALFEPRRTRDRAVDAVGAEQRESPHWSTVDGQRHAVLIRDDARYLDAVAEVGSFARARAREKLVQTAPLRHQAQRLHARPLDRAAVAKPDLESVDRVLDDGRDVHRQLADCAIRQAAPAGLVAWEPGPVNDQDARSSTREAQGRGRTCRAGSDYCDVEPFHPQKATIRRPWGCARVAKGNGL